MDMLDGTSSASPYTNSKQNNQSKPTSSPKFTVHALPWCCCVEVVRPSVLVCLPCLWCCSRPPWCFIRPSALLTLVFCCLTNPALRPCCLTLLSRVLRLYARPPFSSCASFYPPCSSSPPCNFPVIQYCHRRHPLSTLSNFPSQPAHTIFVATT